jgi:hypothetical protein
VVPHLSPAVIEAWKRGDLRAVFPSYRPWWPLSPMDLSLEEREARGHVLPAERTDLEQAIALRDALVVVAGPPARRKAQ